MKLKPDTLKKATVTFSLDLDLIKRIDKIALAQNKPRSVIAGEVLLEWLDNSESSDKQ